MRFCLVQYSVTRFSRDFQSFSRQACPSGPLVFNNTVFKKSCKFEIVFAIIIILYFLEHQTTLSGGTDWESNPVRAVQRQELWPLDHANRIKLRNKFRFHKCTNWTNFWQTAFKFEELFTLASSYAIESSCTEWQIWVWLRAVRDTAEPPESLFMGADKSQWWKKLKTEKPDVQTKKMPCSCTL